MSASMQSSLYESSVAERIKQRIMVHPPFIDRGARILRTVFEFFAYLIFAIVYRKSPKVQLPPVRNEILLDSAAEIAAKIRQRIYKSEDVVAAFAQRIRDVNPLVNCVVDERFEKATKQAKAVDDMLARNEKSEQELENELPFLGVPFTCKDSIAVKGLRQTIGLMSRKEVVADDHAVAVQKLVEAGAIPLAVTNVPEVCLWWESVNPLHGRTLNPYDSRRLVGGSSGGEACLLTSCGSPMGIGSDIGGSIRIPAHFNGIYGHKPTFNVVSNNGSLPETRGELNEFLVIGPMSKRAKDLRPVFKAIAGDAGRKKLQLDKKVEITDLKFYFMEDDGGFPLISPVDGDMKGALHRVVDHLRSHYGVSVEQVHISKFFHAVEMWSFKMSAVEEAPTFCEELADRKGFVNPFWELAKFFLGKSNHSFPAIIVAIAEKLAYMQADTKYQRKMIEGCDHLREEFQHLLGDNGVFLYPSYPHPALFHNQAMLMPFGFAYQSIFNVLKLPVTQCPVGLSGDGLPLGVQVVSRLHNDHLTLSVAEALEETLCQWVPPCEVAVTTNKP